MNIRDEAKALEILLRVMGGDQNALEHMEQEEQRETVQNIFLARDMYPEQSEWEQLGFAFYDIPNDNVLYRATLPEGWTLRSTEHVMGYEIVDENGFVRANMSYKSAIYDRYANMGLKTKYNVESEYTLEETSRTVEIYFGNKQEKLFVAGKLTLKSNASREEFRAYMDEQDRLKALAMAYADEYYPQWRNVHAYWDKEKTKKQNI